MPENFSSIMIRSITQTPDGYLWIATGNDLVRFDGLKSSIISFADKKKIDPLKDITPKALFVDREGTLWIGSDVGLTSYRHQTGRFNTFTSADGLTKDSIRRIKEDMRGNLWISFDASYVNRFSEGKFTIFNASHGLEGKKINAFVEDQKGRLLLGSRENGVFEYKDGKFFKYPVENLGDSQIIIMHEDWKEDLWIGTHNGLFRVIGENAKKYTIENGLSDNYITDIKEDSERNLWVGTKKGLNRVKKKQDGTVDFESLLRPLTIMCLFEDREKNLWVGTLKWGIKRLKDRTFISYEPLEAHQEEILISLFENRHGDTWIGTMSGRLYRCRGRSIIETIKLPNLPNIGIGAIAEDAKGNLWLGTNGKGIIQKNRKNFVQFTTRDGLTDDTVTSIFRDSRDNLWLSTFDGVSVIRHPNGSIESFTERKGLAGKKVHNFYEDKNKNIWIAADRGITVLKNGKVAKQSKTFYMAGVSVPCIYEDPSPPDGEASVFWIATEGAGLKRLSLKGNEIISITSYTTDEGMATNFIYQFFEDQQGTFWLMSNSGILRIGKTELNRFARGELGRINCTSFGISDGMKSSEFYNKESRHSALNAGNGEMWFITKKGISIVNPDNVYINKSLPLVVIEAVFFNRKLIPLYQDAAAYTFKGNRSFTVYFTAPTFLSPGKIKFKYQLEGFDREWIFLPPGKERAAHYQNLNPGSYTFKVIASNSDGIWNQASASFPFTLKPLFYQTLIFKIAVLLLLAAFLAAAIYIYKKRPFGKKKKYKDSPLTPDFAQECIKKLRYLMEVENVYRDAETSLQSLAEKISIKPYLLSQVLNEKLDSSFSDYINYYRIEEAKELLKSSRGTELKIATLAHEVGFSSLTAFYKAFKKFANMTPDQYRKETR